MTPLRHATGDGPATYRGAGTIIFRPGSGAPPRRRITNLEVRESGIYIIDFRPPTASRPSAGAFLDWSLIDTVREAA